MVDRIRNIFIVLFALSLFSCAYVGVPKHIKKGFTFCYSESETNIKELINTDGYFVMSSPHSSSLAIMFYEDGTFLYGFFDVDEDRSKTGDSNISIYLKEVITDKKGQISTVFYKSFQWGYFQINGDTIKAQFVNHPASPSPTWSAWEVWYKVIDRNTIVEIYFAPIHYMSESDWENWKKNKNQREKTTISAKFIPVDEKPIPNCWLKEQKWFWCDKEQYQAWQKEKKKDPRYTDAN